MGMRLFVPPLASLTLGLFVVAAVVAPVVAPVVAAAAPKAKAAGKSAPACGAKILPLVAGNQWTYDPIPAPIAALPALEKISPRRAKQIVIDVKSVEAKGADTVATLSEKITYDLSTDSSKTKLVEQVLTTTITCNAKKFDISPDSFFFAGEPGGYTGMQFDKLERKKETSLKLVNGSIGEDEWVEEIAAEWSQIPAKDSGATLGKGRLELERKFTPQERESVNLKMGQYSAEKLALITSGRVVLATAKAPPDPTGPKPSELPANWINTIWLADNLGVIQTLNAYSHMYQLVDAQLK